MSPPTTERDERAFDRFVREEARRRIEQVTLASVACFGAAWWMGRFVLAGTALDAPGRQWLAIMSGFALVAFLVFRYLPLAGRYPIAFATFFQGALSAVTALSAAGNDGPFFYAIYLLPPLAIGLPMPLGWRVVVSLVGPLVFAVAHFGVQPAEMAFGVPIMVGTATTLVSILLGHKVHEVGQARFFAERELERKRAELAGHAARLEQEVAERSEALEALGRSLERAGVDRADVARALHDDLGQLIVRVRMELDMLEGTLARAPSEDGPPLDHLSSVVEMLDSSVRVFIDRLRHPEPVGELGPALEALVAPLRARANLSIETEVDIGEPLSETSREVVYRFVQEAVTNVFKHAEARRLTIAVRDEPAGVRAEVMDDGRGFDPDAAPTGGLGLAGLRARADALGGTLDVHSVEGEGTRIVLRFPRASLLKAAQ